MKQLLQKSQSKTSELDLIKNSSHTQEDNDYITQDDEICITRHNF